MRSTLHWIGRSLGVVATVTLLAGCADEGTLGPDAAATTKVAPMAAKVPDLGACDSLSVADGNKVAATMYATGAQIYRWSGTSWTFVAPSAVLFPNAQSSDTIGTHYAGPTWQSDSGSKVIGAVMTRCPADPNSIPWLKLRVVSTEGPGIFDGTTFIQRLNTVGGNAPATPGAVTGELANVPYTAEYVFYREK